MRIDFRILGPIEVADETAALRLGGPRQRAVLAILLLQANRVVAVEQIADDLYNDAVPATGVAQVQDHVSQLRKLFGQRRGVDGAEQILETRSPGYMLRVGPDQLDAFRFEGMTEDAFAALGRGDARAAADLLRQALGLWRGAPLADFIYEAFAQPAIARLEELRLGALERRIEADLLLGQDGQLVGELEELVREHPLREQLRAHLMLALYRSGRQAEALEVYHDTRQVLGGELGIEASPALRELAGMVLRQEPALEPSRVPPPQSEAGPATAPTPIRNPYKGLRAFGESDAFDFYGRETMSRRLVERLEEERFVAVVGPSGSGKSSLMLAGLLPALRRGALPGSEAWRIAEMAPGEYPLEELEATLLRVAVNPPVTLMEQLEGDERGLCRAVKRVLPADASELVLVVDQLEELFTLVAGEERRSQFLTLLARAANDPRSRLRVVVTLRADFYDRPLRYREFAELLRDHLLSLTPLSPEEIERAISAPAAAVGVLLEPGLLAEIVADVLDEPGALPLLQYALTELFALRDGATMTRDAYRAVGGVSGALASRADELYARLGESGKAAARQFFLRLVAVGEGEADTRRPVALADLASLDVDQEALAECLDAFGTSRLLSFNRDPRTGASTVDIAHEALLVEWGRLRDWIDAAREEVRACRRLTVRAAEWAESAHDPSFLLRGTELARFEAWADESGLAQTELERGFLRGSLDEREAVLAEEESRRVEQAALERRAVNRLRALVAVLAVAAVVAAGLTVYAFDQSDRSHHQTRIATARQLAAASAANLDVDPELSVLLATQAVQEASVNGAPLPDAVEALHRALAASRVVLTIRTPATGAIALSPDGSRLATAGSIGIAQGVPNYGFGGRVRDVAAGSDAAATKAFAWDTRNGRRLVSLAGATSPIHDVAYSPDGSRIATGADDGTATVWDAGTGKRLFVLPDPGTGGGFMGVGFSQDGKKLATADGVGRIRIWNLGTRRLLRTIEATQPVCGVAWSPDGTLVGAGQCGAYNFSASATRVWDVRSGRLVFRTRGLEAGSVLRFSRDGRYLVTPTSSFTAEIWEIRRQRLVATLTGHSGQVVAVAYSPDDRLVATGATDGTARVWDARSGKQILVLRGHNATVDAVQFTPNSGRLMTASEDGTVRVWDITPEGSRDWLTLAAHRGGVASITYIDGGRLLTVGACDGKTKLWNARSGSLISSTARRRQASCTGQATGQRLYQTVDATSPDGSVVAQASANGTVQLLDSTSGRLIRTLPGGHQGVQAIAFDRGGKRIATGNWDGTTVVWDAASGRSLQTFTGHSGIVESVAFSPDGTLLATAGEDTTAKLWDLKTGKRLLTLSGHTFALTGVAFSPDGTRLATSSGDGTVRVYVLPVKELMAVARARLTRTWSTAECWAYLPGGRCPHTYSAAA
jgi:WD40 repeat protein/DNA-binding SARP family transcriptional activator/energy-coupling factor transporter ATP-binding protein EcfA2